MARDSTSSPLPKSICVIGAGVSGLAAAWRLQQDGADVTVLEKSDRAGGVIRSTREHGFLAETAANEMLLKEPAVEEFIREVGLHGEMLTAAPEAKNRYIVRDGRPRAVPSKPWQAVTTPLFSPKAKLRFLKEPLVQAAKNGADESVADFVRRRLGSEFLDYAIGPLCQGVFAGDPEQLGVKWAFPKVWQLEDRHGGLIRGAFGLKKERKRSGEAPFRKRIIAFREGMEQLPRKLAADLGERVRYEVNVSALRPDNGRWVVTWTQDGKRRIVRFHALIIAVPAYTVPELPFPPDVNDLLFPLREMPYAPVNVAVTAYRRVDVAHPLDGFGMLTSPAENHGILGTVFSSSLFRGRAPKGHVNLMSFVGGARRPDLASDDTEKIYALVQRELQKLLGVHGEPVWRRHHYWPRAIPQYNVGHGRFLEALDAAEAATSGLAFAGNYRRGPGVGDTLLSGLEAAAKLH